MWQAFWGRIPPLYDPFSNMAVPYVFYDDMDEPCLHGEGLDQSRTVDLLEHQKNGFKPGKLDVKALLAPATADHQRMPFGENAARCLTDDSYARSNLWNPEISEAERDRVRARSFRTVSKKAFYVSIALLVTWGLFEWCEQSELYSYGRFFLVPKASSLYAVFVPAPTAS